MKNLMLQLIKWYQLSLAWLNGPTAVCRFSPRCSDYCYDAVSKYGVIKGSWLGLLRISRCHPFHSGGWDPVI
ncbi:MAG: membrane protein insertion efficiency factor YidD [bacterium]|nr:membrane protein insertion efficiency factor YidD [bacterium]